MTHKNKISEARCFFINSLSVEFKIEGTKLIAIAEFNNEESAKKALFYVLNGTFP